MAFILAIGAVDYCLEAPCIWSPAKAVQGYNFRHIKLMERKIQETKFINFLFRLPNIIQKETSRLNHHEQKIKLYNNLCAVACASQKHEAALNKASSNALKFIY